MFKKNLLNKKTLNYLTYVLSFIATVFVCFLLFSTTNISDFFNSMENRTFDLRQKLLANPEVTNHNKDIIIIAIDDPSYEYILDKFGEWPVPRDIYAKMVDYIELQKPTAIAFDLMFIKSIKSNNNADEALVEMFKKHKNVFTAMNFDNQAETVRKPVKLPESISVKVKNDSSIKFKQDDPTKEDLTFSNCRALLPQIIENTSNIGIINVSRSDDGILRKAPLFVKYQDDFYPHLSLATGLEVLKQREGYKERDFYIDKHSNLILGDRKIPIDKDGGAILNWYGPSNNQTFEHVPFYLVYKAMIGDKDAPKFNFKNKVIYFGATAVSLFDTKSVPVDKVYPGVELHTTYLNNLLDNNFIKKVDERVNIAISILLALFVGIIVIRSTSTVSAVTTTALTIVGYIILTILAMKFYNLWVAVVLPVATVLLIFIFAYIVKYLLKSRDFEYQYKLATTDGLTELYNHRYFQEQMLMQIDNCKRYDSNFSLILIDIDFFKKFNDTYGHQAGDAVLKQVAYTLKKNVRSTDIVCRYGGEEMSIILSNTDKDEAIITAQKICQSISEKPFKIGVDVNVPVTISLGVATYPQDGQKSSELIEHADQGLYKAKENGRNQVGL